MKPTQSAAIFLAMAAMTLLPLGTQAQQGNQQGNQLGNQPAYQGYQSGNQGGNGISMTIYPVVRKADGNQYLITPSGKEVTVPGLVIAPNANQVSVYRDLANHFWYTAMNGQQIAVTPEQLEAAQAQINMQSGGGGMSQQMMAPAQSYYNSTPTYAGGYNGIPYGTPVSVEGPGQYSYMAQGGNKQFVTPTPQTSTQFNQFQQQVPYGQSQQGQSSAQNSGGESRMDRRRENRAERLENRSKEQASDAKNDQASADQKMQSGQTLGTGFSARRSAREERRSKREEKRADRLDGSSGQQ